MLHDENGTLTGAAPDAKKNNDIESGGGGKDDSKTAAGVSAEEKGAENGG